MSACWSRKDAVMSSVLGSRSESDAPPAGEWAVVQGCCEQAVGGGEGPWGAQESHVSSYARPHVGPRTAGGRAREPCFATSWVLKAPGPEPLPSVSGCEPVTLAVPWAPADAG